MNTFKKILLGVLALAVLLVIVGFLLPSSVRVERQVSIAAPPPVVFGILNSYKRYNDWSPRYEFDPAARYTMSGPDQGVGARLEWASDKPEVGSGSQEIVASEPNRLVRTRLDFGSQGVADAHFDIAPEGEGTRVTWVFDSEFGYNIPQRYFGLIIDSVVGSDYEKGLRNLKTLAEAEAARPQPATPAQPTVEDVGASELATLEGITSLDPAAVAKALDDAFGRINSFLTAQGLKTSGASIAVTRFYDESGWGFEAGVPFSGSEAARAKAASAAGNGIRMRPGYSGKAVKSVHLGSHSTLPETYQRLEDYVAAKGLETNGRPWEAYVTDRRNTPEAQLRTDVYIPVKVVN